MKKRFLALFTAGVLSISLLAGCSGGHGADRTEIGN